MAIPPSDPTVGSYAPNKINQQLEDFINSPKIDSDEIEWLGRRILNDKDLLLASPNLLQRTISILTEFNKQLDSPESAQKIIEKPQGPATFSSYLQRVSEYLFGGKTQSSISPPKELTAKTQDRQQAVEFREKVLQKLKLAVKKQELAAFKFPPDLWKEIKTEGERQELRDRPGLLKKASESLQQLIEMPMGKPINDYFSKVPKDKKILSLVDPKLLDDAQNKLIAIKTRLTSGDPGLYPEQLRVGSNLAYQFDSILESLNACESSPIENEITEIFQKFEEVICDPQYTPELAQATISNLAKNENLLHSEIQLLQTTRDVLLLRKEAAAAYPETQQKIDMVLQEFEKLLDKREDLKKIPPLPKELWGEIAKKNDDLHTRLQTTQVSKGLLENRTEILSAELNDPNKIFTIEKLKDMLEKFPELKPRVTSLNLNYLGSAEDLIYLKENCPNLKELRCDFAKTNLTITREILPNVKYLKLAHGNLFLKSLPTELESLVIMDTAIVGTPGIEDQTTRLKELELEFVVFINCSSSKLFPGLNKLTLYNVTEEAQPNEPELYRPNLAEFKGQFLKIDQIAGGIPATVTHLTTTEQTNFKALPKGLEKLEINTKNESGIVELINKAPINATVLVGGVFAINLDNSEDLINIKATFERLAVQSAAFAMEKLPSKIVNLRYQTLPEAIEIPEDELRQKLSLMPKERLTTVQFEILGKCSEEAIAQFQAVLLDTLPKGVTAEIKYGFGLKNTVSFSKR